jgi:transposase
VPATAAVGVALGINDLATICDSRGHVTVVRSEEWPRRAEKRLKRLQRSVARCNRTAIDARRRSVRWRSRTEGFAISGSTGFTRPRRRFVEAVGHIAIEALPIHGLMGEPRLARTLADSGLGEFLRQKGSVTYGFLTDASDFRGNSKRYGPNDLPLGLPRSRSGDWHRSC